MATAPTSQYEIGGLTVSGSVRSVISSEDSRISAHELALRLFRLHPDYASGRGLNLVEPVRSLLEMTASEWLRQIRPLFDSERVFELNGRAVVLGLALVDDTFGKAMRDSGTLADLVDEMERFYQSPPSRPRSAPRPRQTSVNSGQPRRRTDQARKK